MASIPGVTERMLWGLFWAITLFGCGDDETGDEVGESSSESQSTDEAESEDSSNEGSTGSTDDEASTDSTDSDSTDSDSTETDSTETDSTETDSTDSGDPSCEDDSYTGVALASDDWGIGDLCDEIWVCADEAQVPLIQAAVPNATCEPGQGCPVSHCTISYQTIVDAAVFAAVCDALLVPGIDEAFCVVYGP